MSSPVQEANPGLIDGTQPFHVPAWLHKALSGLDCVLFRREMDAGGQVSYPYISGNISCIVGATPEELSVGRSGALNVIHWADRDGHLAAIHQSARDLGPCMEQFRVITAAGETRWMRGVATPQALDGGGVAWQGAWLDISPWMRAETQFQTVMDRAEDCIVTLDEDSRVNWSNAAIERLFGYSVNEMRGMALAELFNDPGDPACHPDLQVDGSREAMARRADGSIFPFEFTVSEVRSDGRLSLMLIGRDITRRKTAELMLEESERRLRSIAANLPGVVFQRELKPDGTITYPYVSEGIREILGCEPVDMVNNPALLFHAMIGKDHARLMTAMIHSAKTLEPMREDVRVTGSDWRPRWLRGQSRPRMRGDAVVWDGVLLDATEEVEERRKAEEAVRESEERFRQAFAAASLGIVVTGLDGVIQQVNPAFRAMVGQGEREMKGTNVHDFIAATALPSTLPLPGEPFCFIHVLDTPELGERHWRVTGTLFSATTRAKYHSLLFLIDDISDTVRAADERRQLELALQEGQKLEALGRLAGGVAHELNNMLGPILMGAEMLDRTLQLDDKSKERVARIIEATKHGRDIVRNVLAYCRKEQQTLSAVDLVPVVAQAVSLIQSAMPPTIKVERDIRAETAPIMGDAGQIHQVLLNLANNAKDAMAGSGTLSLSLVLVPAGALEPPRAQDGRADPFARLDETRPHVEIRVADTGSGMRPATVAKIFDPFFTTKPVGQGTGLGLSVVQGIVKAMGGAIAVDSELGVGTTFRIAIPLAQPPC